ncbi:MAG: protein kinase [Armatimonadetes bacterium]|nr:protein kinase [Armatimonadota bacterium]
MKHDASGDPGDLPSGPDEDGAIDEELAGYIDRLNRGEILDEEKVLAEHPTNGGEIWSRLEVFRRFGPGSSPGRQLGELGDYTLRRQIGRGGMGVVYEAWQNSMERRVALKVLPQAVAADMKAVSRFIREAQVAGKLNHPNIVRVHGMGVEEQIPYYAMEYGVKSRGFCKPL